MRTSSILDEDVQLPGAPDGPGVAEPEADLSLTRSGLPSSISAGENAGYALTVTNTGPSDATAVVLTEALPSGIRAVSATPSQGTCNISGGAVSCQLDAIGSGSEVVVHIMLTVGPSLAGDLTITGSVESDEIDPNTGNNTADANISVLPLPTPTPTRTPVPTPTSAPTPTATPPPTATFVPTPTLEPTSTPVPPPTTTPLPTTAPTSTPTATPAPTPTDLPATGPPESTPPGPPSGGSCSAPVDNVPATLGVVNLLVLAAPLAMIGVYRRIRK